MTIEQILILINNHWITFVITAWVLYFLFKITNLFYIKLERKIIKDHAKDLKEKWPETIKKNSIIHQLLYKALYEMGWDRAYIFEYHNGWHSISWIDFLKCSNTFEVVNEMIQPKQVLLQNLPIGMFAFWNLQVLANKPVCVLDIESIKTKDVWAYQVLKQQWIKSTLVFGLYDAQSNAIWFFGVDFINKKINDCNEETIRKMELLSYRIAGLLY